MLYKRQREGKAKKYSMVFMYDVGCTERIERGLMVSEVPLRSVDP